MLTYFKTHISESFSDDSSHYKNQSNHLLSYYLGGLWRPYGIFIAAIWSSLAEKVAVMAEKLAQPFTQS